MLIGNNFSILFLSTTILLVGCKVQQVANMDQQPIPVIAQEPETEVQSEIHFDNDDPIIQQLNERLSEVQVEIENTDTIKFAAVGDIMIGSSFPDASYIPRGNGRFLWDDCREVLKSADITFGNLEGTVLDGEGEAKECKNPDVCYLFKMPTRLASNLTEAGFDLISVANNHANDFGKAGRLSTQRTLDSLAITYAGSTEQPYTSTVINGIKIGLVAFAPNRGTLGFYDIAYAESIVRKLDSLNDIVIVSIHGGAEGAQNMHITRKTEFYFGEDRGNIYNFSHKMIDAGADLVFGHGPHVVRAIEVYKNRLIAYSLGNFLTYGRFNVNGSNGEAPVVLVNTTSKGEFIEGQIASFYQLKNQGPLKDSQNRAANTIRKLSVEDFPENPIMIDEKGRIIYIQR